MRCEGLCRQAAEEKDTKKLAELVTEINRMLLEEREAKLGNKRPSVAVRPVRSVPWRVRGVGQAFGHIRPSPLRLCP